MALLPADDDIDLRAFADALVEQLEGSATVRDAASFAAEAPTAAALADDPSLRRFGTWLSGAESDHDAVLLLVRPQVDAWTRACIEAADEIVLVCRSDGEVALNPVERALAVGELTGEVVSLVSCHPPGTLIVEDDGTLEPWVGLRPKLVFLHRVTLGDRRDFAQLGRGLFRG
jgi:hypothetical protein